MLHKNTLTKKTLWKNTPQLIFCVSAIFYHLFVSSSPPSVSNRSCSRSCLFLALRGSDLTNEGGINSKSLKEASQEYTLKKYTLEKYTPTNFQPFFTTFLVLHRLPQFLRGRIWIWAQVSLRPRRRRRGEAH